MKVKARGLDPEEGVALMTEHMKSLKKLSPPDLRAYFEPQVDEFTGDSDLTYELETQAFWDDRHRTNIRVIARLDAHRGRRGRLKIVDDFIKAPDGSLIGEP